MDGNAANYAALRKQVAKNYDAVVARYPNVTFRVVREDR